MKVTRIQIIIMLIGIFTILIAYLSEFHTKVNIFIAIMTMALCCLNLWKSRNDLLAFLLHLQLLYYNYSVVFSRYLHVMQEYGEFYNNVNDQILGIGITCIFIFELCMTFYVRKNTKFFVGDIYSKRPNELISIALLLTAICIGIFAFDWSSFGTRGAVTPYYEYVGIVLILGLHFSGYKKSRMIKYSYSILIIALIIQGLIFGERVSALQFIFIWLFFFIGERLKSKYALLFSLIGIFMMTIVGTYRATYVIHNFSLPYLWARTTERLFTFDGADLGYYSSLTFAMVADRVSWKIKVELFCKFLLSVIIGNFSGASLPEFTRRYYMHWYGGFFPLYFYFYGSIPGVIIACLAWCRFICKGINNTFTRHKNFFYLLSLYLVCITARWYMYTPLSALRTTLLFTITYLALDMINKTLEKKHGRI